MAISSIRKAEHQREGVLRLEMVMEEPYMRYPVTAVVPLDHPQKITIVSASRHLPPSEEVKTAVREYLQENGSESF